jgi:hypothetical protein
LFELDQVVDRLLEAWQRARRSGDDLYLDSVALNLHGFYSGIERIFERLAETLDGSLPKGENWHQALLVQMSKEVTRIRPAVISQQTLKRLPFITSFYLAGGTGLSLHLGHRFSVDLDFFSPDEAAVGPDQRDAL